VIRAISKIKVRVHGPDGVDEVQADETAATSRKFEEPPMKHLVNIALFALTTLSVLSPANAGTESYVCTSNGSAHVAEGTVIDHAGDAGAEAERRAVDTATELCAANDDGSPIFIEINTRQSGVVASSTARFFCSASC
jgi:hypothetical protein